MKNLNLLLFLLSFIAINAQIVQDDFEGNGTINSWYGDDCGMDNNFANPFLTGINTSATVLEYNDTGGQFANVRFDAESNFDLTLKNTFSLKIYVPSNGLSGSQNNQVSLKLQDGTIAQPWITQSEIIKPIALDTWQEVTFNFDADNFINLDPNSLPPSQRTDFNRMLIQVNGENNFDAVVAYVDAVLFFETTSNAPVYDNLVWSDEFDTDGAINPVNWHHQTQLPNGGSWFNGEIQHYTNRVDNAFVSGGFLNVLAKKETFTDQGFTKQYTSARLNSKFAFTYGKVEVRAKLPFGVGTWPAIWMLGKNINEDGGYWDIQGFDTTSWPACGEIDIMEHWGHNQNFVQSAMHTPSSSGATVNHGGQNNNTASIDYHVYTLVWSPEKMVFSVDGIVHYTYNPTVKNASTWPFFEEQYILLNVAMLPNVTASFTQSAMEIDYVRVYQESTLSTTAFDTIKVLRIYPNPVDDILNIKVNTSSVASYSVKDVSGRLITNVKINRPLQVLAVDATYYSNGLYFITVTLENGSIETVKFIKK